MQAIKTGSKIELFVKKFIKICIIKQLDYALDYGIYKLVTLPKLLALDLCI